MKKIILLYIFCISLIACQQESLRTRNLSSCVNTQERILSRYTGFYVFHKGFQERGFAQAIKINKRWDASASATFIQNQSVIFITFNTHLTEEAHINNISEIIDIDFFYNYVNNGCFKLERKLPVDSSSYSARINYHSTGGDVALDSYQVEEESNNNYLEIEEIDLEARKISGRFMVTFLRNSEETPISYNLPVVRFFNGYFEADLNFFPEND